MFDIRPLTCDIGDFGPEPSIRQIIKFFYMTHGFSLNNANELTEKYIVQLLKDYNASLDSRTTN